MFLPIKFSICFGAQKTRRIATPSHCDGSFEQQNMCFVWEIRKLIFNYLFLSLDQYHLNLQSNLEIILIIML